jgi:DNA replication and repair protein RecF
MPLTDLRLQHFRSYEDSYFELSPGVTVIAGPNASGKTNLLEAILVVARGGSYRAKDAELVAFGAPWARLDARMSETDPQSVRTVKLDCTASQAAVSPTCKKSFVIEGKPFLRMSQQKSLPAVLFEPNHLLLLTGSPELRRSYLDDLAEQTEPGFGALRRQYRRVLTQRNALLKLGHDQAARQIFVWDVRLSELAGKLVRARLGLLEHINRSASQVYDDISHSAAEVELEYITSVTKLAADEHAGHYESALLHRLEHSLERDCYLGFTSAGPHRDDMRVVLNGHVSQETASRGETRTLILMLKIIELQLLEAARDHPPLLLLDDVFSELDALRRQALTSFLEPYQTFITTTDADVLSKQFIGGAQLISLS